MEGPGRVRGLDGGACPRRVVHAPCRSVDREGQHACPPSLCGGACVRIAGRRASCHRLMPPPPPPHAAGRCRVRLLQPSACRCGLPSAAAPRRPSLSSSAGCATSRTAPPSTCPRSAFSTGSKAPRSCRPARRPPPGTSSVRSASTAQSVSLSLGAGGALRERLRKRLPAGTAWPAAGLHTVLGTRAALHAP